MAFSLPRLNNRMMGLSWRVLTYEEYHARRYFESLDGVRALSILLVISVHLGDNILDGVWGWLCGQGGVAVFFVLSGYLITMLALREEQERGRLSLKAFYVRRTLRIFPAYYYFVGVSALLIFSSGGEGSRGNFSAALPYYLTYMGEYAPVAHFFHSWSLGLEEKFYLAWPVLCFVALRGHPKGRIAAAAVLAFAVPVFAYGALWNSWNRYPRIMFGCLLALALADKRLYQRLRPWATGWRACAGLVAACGLHFMSSHDQSEFGGLAEGFYTLAIGLVVLALVAGHPPWGRLLASRPMRFIGRRAYGIYLIHVACIWGVEAFARPGSGTVWGQMMGYLLAFLLSLLAADVLYRVVERPAILAGRKISERILAERPSAA